MSDLSSFAADLRSFSRALDESSLTQVATRLARAGQLEITAAGEASPGFSRKADTSWATQVVSRGDGSAQIVPAGRAAAGTWALDQNGRQTGRHGRTSGRGTWGEASAELVDSNEDRADAELDRIIRSTIGR